MGTYRTLHAPLPCLRCGVVRPTEVQFKTGADRGMPEYQVGDRADDVAPGCYEGIADAYCQTCASRWVDAEKRVQLELLAADVAAGRVVARRPGDSAPVSAAEIRARAEVADPFEWPRWESFAAHLSDLALWRGELRLHPHGADQAATEWWIRRHEEVAARLLALGWPEGAFPTVDLAVRIDADHRVGLDPGNPG